VIGSQLPKTKHWVNLQIASMKTMGWGRWLLLGNLGQQMDLADHEAEIESLKEELRSKQAVPSSIEQRLETLQRENHELKLYLAAVLRLLVGKKVATRMRSRRWWPQLIARTVSRTRSSQGRCCLEIDKPDDGEVFADALKAGNSALK
jgi:hypothetical protein